MLYGQGSSSKCFLKRRSIPQCRSKLSVNNSEKWTCILDDRSHEAYGYGLRWLSVRHDSLKSELSSFSLTFERKREWHFGYESPHTNSKNNINLIVGELAFAYVGEIDDIKAGFFNLLSPFKQESCAVLIRIKSKVFHGSFRCVGVLRQFLDNTNSSSNRAYRLL